MSLNIAPVPLAETPALVPILHDAEEGDERILATLHDPACVAYAAHLNGQLIGAAAVHWGEGEDSEIVYIAVAPEQRGQGYGKQIIAALQAELAARGRQSLLVGTANSSLENIAFYQRCGFRMFEIRRDYFAYIQPPLQEHGILIRDMIVLRYDVK